MISKTVEAIQDNIKDIAIIGSIGMLAGWTVTRLVSAATPPWVGAMISTISYLSMVFLTSEGDAFSKRDIAILLLPEITLSLALNAVGFAVTPLLVVGLIAARVVAIIAIIKFN